MTIQRHTLLLALVAPLTACHAHFEGYGSPGAQVIHVGELESNDYEWDAQHIGWVDGGDAVIIEGHISDDGWDPRDGFALFAEHPILVEVVLDAHEPGVDLDWCVWDPYVSAYTVCSESDINPETGSFIVVPPGEEFHLVVSSFLGDSTYTLEMFVSTFHPATLTGDEPEGTEEPDAPKPRGDATERYGDDRRWDVPDPTRPIFAGPQFTFEPLDGAVGGM